VSLFAKRTYPTAGEMIPARIGVRRGSVTVNNETALRHSAVWACLRLRANLVSTMPVDLYRRVNGQKVDMPKPPVLVNPGGEKVGMGEWLYSTQFDLDRAGNAFGLITQRDGRDNPSRIELLALDEVQVQIKGGQISGYRVGGDMVSPDKIWHEKQNTVAGLQVGLSPVAYAAWSVGEYLSIQDFALDWFGNSTVPAAHLKQTAKTLTAEEAVKHKERFAASVQSGQPWVTGNDWEYMPLTQANQSNEWIAGKQFGIGDIARFFDCPGDLIDAVVTGGNITYANITQRNLQFLIMHLQPAITRRETALTTLTPRPQFVKLNTDVLLRMDPLTRAQVIQTQITSRTLAPSEARSLDDRPPFTEAQLAEFDRLFIAYRDTTTHNDTPAPVGATPDV
jgi:HK97 family phage portal protein